MPSTHLPRVRLIGLLILLTCSAGQAQEPETVEPGERIRVYSHFGRLEARFDRLAGDTLVLRRGVDQQWFINPLDSIRSIVARRCCASRGTGRLRGAIIGSLVGSVLGVGGAVVACESERYVCDPSDGAYRQSLTLFVLSRSLLGAAVGAVWGHYHPGDTWTPVVLPRVSVGSDRQGCGRIDLSLQVAW